MKKLAFFIVFSLLVVSAMASVSFTFMNTGMNPGWSALYSQKYGNIYLMGIMGTSGFGVAAGYVMSFPIRQRMGFLNPVVGTSTYALALGMNLTQNVPAAYFRYELTHSFAPFIYDFKFTAGNYGLPNFGVGVDTKLYITLLDFSMYVREHSKLIFQTYMENFGLVSAALKNWRGGLIFTDELGPTLLSTVGWSTKWATVNAGIGYNGKLGFALGISSPKFDVNGGWWVRYLKSGDGSTFLCEILLPDMELTAGYNRGAVYVSFER